MSEHKNLWEGDHPYYCNHGNFFTNESCETYYKSWSEFLAEQGHSDMDMNLVFRWDWREEDEETGAPTFNGDVNYRNGKICIYWMGQRKGIYRWSVVEVCRADEAAIREFLIPRMEHLIKLWSPLTVIAGGK